MRKIYVPFPGIRQEDKEYILTSPPKKKEEWQERKKKRFALKFQNPLSEHVNKKQVIIYTDGACHQMDKTGNGIGGWAYSITEDGKEIAYGVRIENIVTNGDMEVNDLQDKPEGLDVSVLPIGSVSGLPVAPHPYG